MLLARLYGLQQHAVHDPYSLDWPSLSPSTIVQVHWPHSPAFADLLEQTGFVPIAIARHPFDVLLSILQFSRRELDTRHWLLGSGDGEAAIRGAVPSSPAFNAYATSDRAAQLLSVSCDWWTEKRVLQVRYEDLASHTTTTLRDLTHRLGPPIGAIEDCVAEHSLHALRKTSVNGHFWQGTPGLWKRLLTQSQVERLQCVHAPVLEALGYDPQPSRQMDCPSEDNAAQAWLEMVDPQRSGSLT